MFIPGSSSYSSTEHVAIATQDTVSVLTPGKGVLLTLDQVIGGKLSCMDCTADHLALGVGSFGYGTLGNKVSESNFVIRTLMERSEVSTLQRCPHFKGWAFPSWSSRWKTS